MTVASAGVLATNLTAARWQAMVVGLGTGALLIVPSLILLLTLFQRRPSTPEGKQGGIS